MTNASNSAKMTLEEKLVQSIKESALGSLVADEDAITDLVKRAVHEALFQPTRVPRSYGGWDEKDSIAVATAKELAKAAAEQVFADLVTELSANEDFRKVCVEGMIAALPAALSSGTSSMVYGIQHAAANDAVMRVQELARQNLLK